MASKAHVLYDLFLLSLARRWQHRSLMVFCRGLYRRSLKLALDWAVHRYIWRGQAVYIRELFEANRNVTAPRQRKVRF